MKQGNLLRHAMTACRNDACCSYDHPPRDADLAAAGLVQDGDDFRLLVDLNARFAAGERQSEDVWICGRAASVTSTLLAMIAPSRPRG